MVFTRVFVWYQGNTSSRQDFSPFEKKTPLTPKKTFGHYKNINVSNFLITHMR